MYTAEQAREDTDGYLKGKGISKGQIIDKIRAATKEGKRSLIINQRILSDTAKDLEIVHGFVVLIGDDHTNISWK